MSIFISYSRKDTAFVRRLHEALAAQQRDTWVDWIGIPPSADWMREIEAAIDAAEAFVFVLSPDAAASAVCQRELAHAVAQNKRLLPVVCRDVDATTVPPAVARLNWVWFGERHDFTAAVATLLQAVDTDLDWVRAHTRLLMRAAEWQARAEDASAALQGSELAAAEQWLALGPTRQPSPTALQTRYVLQSRQQATRRRLRLLGAGGVAVAVIAVLGTLFVFQRQATARQDALAAARRLASVSERLREQPGSVDAAGNSSRDLSLQLAAEGVRRLQEIGERALEVDLALRRAIALAPLAVPVAGPVHEPTHGFDALVFSDQRLTAVSTSPLAVHRWVPGSLGSRPAGRQGSDAKPRAVSPDGAFVATQAVIGRESSVDIWPADTTAAPVRLAGDGRTVAEVVLLNGGTHAVLGTHRFDNASSRWLDQSAALWRIDGPAVLATLPLAHGLQLSPGGRHLAAEVAGNVQVWDMVGLLAGDTAPRIDLGPASRAAFSADGGHLLLVRPDVPEGAPDGVEIWRVDTWQRTAQLPLALDGVLGPGARWMAVRDDVDAGGVRIIDLATRRERARLLSGVSGTPFAFSPDGQRLAIGGVKRVDVWRMAPPGGAAASLQAAPARRVGALADGGLLLSGPTGPTGLRVWTVGADGARPLAVADSAASVPASAAAASAQGALAAAARAQGVPAAPASASGASATAAPAPGASPTAAPAPGASPAVAPAPGASPAAVPAPGAPAAAVPAPGASPAAVPAPGAPAAAVPAAGAPAAPASAAQAEQAPARASQARAPVAAAPAAVRLASSSLAASVPPPVPPSTPPFAPPFALSADGRSAASASGSRAELADAASGRRRAAVVFPGPLRLLALSADAAHLAGVTQDNRLHLAQPGAAQPLAPGASVALPPKTTAMALAVADGGAEVVVLVQHPVSRAGERQELLVWRRGATSALAALPVDKHGGLASTVCGLSPRGDRFAVDNRGTSIQLRDTRTGADLVTVDEGGRGARCVFSADGRTFAATGAGDTVRVWDVAAGAEIARLEGLPDVADMAFTPGAHTLATLLADGTLQTWPLRYADLLASACARLRSNLSVADGARYLGAAPARPACPALPAP